MLAVVAIVKHELHEKYKLCYAHTHKDNIDLVSERVVTNNMRLKTPGIHDKLGFILYLLPLTSYTKKKQNSTTQSFLFSVMRVVVHAHSTRSSVQVYRNQNIFLGLRWSVGVREQQGQIVHFSMHCAFCCCCCVGCWCLHCFL